MSERSRNFLRGVMPGLWIPLVLGVLGWLFPAGAAFVENRARDLYFAGRRDTPALRTVAVVGFDQATLAHYGFKLRLDQREHARLVRRLKAAGARAVAFDFAFVEQGDAPGPTADFALACREAGNVVLGAVYSDDGDRPVLQRPIPALAAAAAGLGVLYHPLDVDSVIRRARLTFDTADGRGLAFALRAWAVAEGVADGDLEPGPGALAVRYGVETHRIPLDAEGAMRIRYAGPPGTVPTYSFVDVVQGKVPDADLAGRVIFVGPTAEILQDIRLVPSFSYAEGRASSMTGVEIHAHTFMTLASGLAPGGSFLVDLPPAGAVLLMLLLGLATALPASLLDIRLSPLVLVLVPLYFILSNHLLFLGASILPPLLGPLTVIVLVYLAVVISRYLSERASRRQVREMFQHFVPAHVVERLEQDPTLLQAPGMNRDLSVLFCDIRDFTPLAERLGAQRTVAVLNRYFEAMTEVILARDGMIDKFVGDAILAVFGEPVSAGNHAARAVEAALDMRQALAVLNRDPEFRSLLGDDRPIDSGIAVNSGDMIVGNLGSARRKDYTVIGDAVNLCSRLEGLAKGDNPRIIISEATYARTRDLVAVVPLGEVRVKGKAEPVVAYGVTSRTTDGERAA